MAYSGRNALYESNGDFPSNLLHSSVQLRDTSAPFQDLPSDDDSHWPSHAHQSPEDEDEDDEVEVYLESTNSATPGPPRTLPRGDGATPKQAGRLREVMDALGQVPRSNQNRPPSPQAPRSEVESDFDDQEQYQPFKQSMKDIFKRAAMTSPSFDDSNAQTPLAQMRNGASRTPPSAGQGSRMLMETPLAGRAGPPPVSLNDDESEADIRAATPPPTRQAAVHVYDALRARLDDPDYKPSLPSTDHERSPRHTPPGSPRIQDLNESASSLPDDIQRASGTSPLGSPGEPSTSRPRSTSALGFVRPRMSLLSNRKRVVSAHGKDVGEINFPSSEVDSSTPVKPTKSAKDWFRPTIASFTRALGSLPRPPSPVEVWERERERNWNNPQPKDVPDRPPLSDHHRHSLSPTHSPHGSPSPSNGLSRRTSMESLRNGLGGRDRPVSSLSMSSTSSFNTPAGKGKGRPSPSPSPGSFSHNRSRAISNSTPAEEMYERERGWNKPTPSPSSRVRTTSMPSLDASIAAAKGAPAQSPASSAGMTRSRSLQSPNGRASPDVKGRHSGIPLRTGRAVTYQPAQPTSTLIRRSSLIGVVDEEPEADGDGTYPEEDRPPSPASSVPSRPDTPVYEEDGSDMSMQQSQMERDTSRLQRAIARPSTPPMPEASTTPKSTPASRPVMTTNGHLPNGGTTTPDGTPLRRDPVMTTPSKRSFYEPKEMSTPSPPKGGMPALPSMSDEEDGELTADDGRQVLRNVREPVKGVVVPLKTFGRRSPLLKTPKPPGGWNTPAATPATIPQFDDREHPHPKGAALDLKKREEEFESELSVQSDSEIPSPRQEPVQVQQRVFSSPQTPQHLVHERDQEESRSAPSTVGRTPYPPGHWAQTPKERKSALKVRFDSPTLSSSRKPTSRPTTPDAVRDDSMKILSHLAGQSSPNSPSFRRSRVNMVDSYGRDMFASDGTPIRRKDSSDGDSSAVQPHITTPNKRRPAMRMVDSFGQDIVSSNSRRSGPLDGGVVDLTTPIEGPGQDEERNSDMEHSLHENIPRVRKSLDGLLGGLGLKDEEDNMSWSSERMAELGRTMDNASQDRKRYQGELQRMYASVPITELPSARSGSGASIKEEAEVTSGTRTVRTTIRTVEKIIYRLPWLRMVLIFLFLQCLFIILINRSGMVQRRAEDLFLSTYHDPTFAGFYTSGDSNALTAAEWFLSRNPNELPKFTPDNVWKVRAWLGYLAYEWMGSTMLLETTFAPNLVPT